MAEQQIDQFLNLITEYGTTRTNRFNSPEHWKIKYASEINEDDAQNFVNTSVDYLTDYHLKNSLLYSDLISDTLLSTNDLLLFDSCDKYFKFLLFFKIYGCSQNKIIKYIEEIDGENMDQFTILYNIINQNKSIFSDFLLVPTSRFTATFFREKVLHNHMCHGRNKKILNLISKNSFYNYILGWDIDNENYCIYKTCGDRFEEKVAAARLSSKKLTVGTLSQITDFNLLSSDTNHDNLDDAETGDKKKKKNNKLLEYMILSQFINKN